MKQQDAVQRTLCRIEQKERKYLEKAAIGSGLTQKLSIPEKAKEALTRAFAKGLALVLDKGDGLILRGVDADKIRRIFETQNQTAHPKLHAKQIRAAGAQARQIRRKGAGAALAEGAALGILGIGLPDIPIFLGVLLRGVYQIALSYGAQIHTEDERVYLLLLLSCAAAPSREKQVRLDRLAKQLISGEAISETRQFVQQEAAEALAQGMLTIKFIQGLPLIGVVGGVYNLPLYRRITGYAELAYQKRYLWKRTMKKNTMTASVTGICTPAALRGGLVS